MRRWATACEKTIYICSIIGMSGGWNDEELKATVESYVEMQRNEHAGLFFVKKQYYRKLTQKFGRAEKAYELRMQNVSYVLSLMGRGVAGRPQTGKKYRSGNCGPNRKTA